MDTPVRIVDPPPNEWGRFRTPLTPGERLFAEYLLNELPSRWEIYIQPHMNGLRPDFVLLNPDVGIAVYEVKDWNLGALRYEYEYPANRDPVLWASDGIRRFPKRGDDPLSAIECYRREIFDLYLPSFHHNADFGVIRAGVVLPFAKREQAELVFGRARDIRGHSNYPKLYPLITSEDLKPKNIRRILNCAHVATDDRMSPKVANELRHWLVEPQFSAEQRQPPVLDERQTTLQNTRTVSGYRRVKGPAGCGKSLVLAARAARLASEGRRVLVATYNITLRQYLQDYSVRFGLGRRDNSVDWLNFHYWCKRVCFKTGHSAEYKALWRGVAEDDERATSVLNVGLPALVERILAESPELDCDRYDAVLVDEGQDFRLEWWSALRKAITPDGEAVLFADKTQDLYGTAPAWTDEAMKGAGFPGGPWVQLKGSYRMPEILVPLMRNFSERFLPAALRDSPESPDGELELSQCAIRWEQVLDGERLVDALLREIQRLIMMDDGHPSMADLAILVQSANRGREVCHAVRALGIDVVDTFGASEEESRKRKFVFFKGHPSVKVTTIKSFKGWEGTAMIVLIDHASDAEGLAEAYVGMTRVRRSEAGSFLSVICAAPELEAYGSTWPGAVARQVSPAQVSK